MRCETASVARDSSFSRYRSLRSPKTDPIPTHSQDNRLLKCPMSRLVCLPLVIKPKTSAVFHAVFPGICTWVSWPQQTPFKDPRTVDIVSNRHQNWQRNVILSCVILRGTRQTPCVRTTCKALMKERKVKRLWSTLSVSLQYVFSRVDSSSVSLQTAVSGSPRAVVAFVSSLRNPYIASTATTLSTTCHPNYLPCLYCRALPVFPDLVDIITSAR